MAHVEKFTRQQVTGVANHIERKTEHHSNKDIDPTKTHLNYSHLDDGLDLNQRLQNRLKEVSVLNRKDVNVMSSWIVTLPQELIEASQSEIKEFFKSTHNFLKKRYGGLKNVLASEVHVDETTPHLHFAFVPTIFDEKRGKDRVNAKLVVSRNDLKAFHGDLDAHLKADIPKVYEKGVVNGKTLGLDSVEQIKLHDDIIKIAKQRAEVVEVQYQAKKEYVDSIKYSSELSKKIPEYAKIEKNIFGSKEFVKVPREKWEERTVSWEERKAITEARQAFEKRARDFERSETFYDLRLLKKEYQEVVKENHELKVENETLKSKAGIFNLAESLLNVFKEPILKNFDYLHWLAERIPHEKLSDFCVAGLETILSRQNELDISLVTDVAIDGWNNGIEITRQEYNLFKSTQEYELNQNYNYEIER